MSEDTVTPVPNLNKIQKLPIQAILNQWEQESNLNQIDIMESEKLSFEMELLLEGDTHNAFKFCAQGVVVERR